MNYKIIVDSCCDLSDYELKKFDVDLVPLKIKIGDLEFVDDLNINTLELLNAMKSSDVAVKTSCPSPNDYYQSYLSTDADIIFVITLTSKLSGSYNSAMLAKEMIELENPNKKVYVFDSQGAAPAQVLMVYKLNDYMKLGLDVSDIVDKMKSYVERLKTRFVLESLENLIKAGRLSNLKGMLANLLSLKPLMGDDGSGMIMKLETNRGIKKSLKKLVERIGEEAQNISELRCAISHCNCAKRAEDLKKSIEEKYNFKEVIVNETRGVATVYAYDGGIIVSYLM